MSSVLWQTSRSKLVPGSLIAVSAFVGFVAALHHWVGGLMLVAALCAAIIVRYGELGLCCLLVSSLPWLAVFSAVLPHLVKTTVAVLAVWALFHLTGPRLSNRGASLIAAGGALWLLPVVLSVRRGALVYQVEQTGHYVMFLAIALVVVAASRREFLPTVCKVTAYSGLLAMAVDLGLGLSGIGKGTLYHSGELLGLASAHDLAFMASGLAAGALALKYGSLSRVTLTCVAAVAAVVTGVRTATVALVFVALHYLATSHRRLRGMLAVAVVVGVVLLSGAGSVLANREQHSQSSGEFTTVSTYGSGRGSIWTVVLARFAHASPAEWLTGSGVGSVQDITQQSLGQTFVAHNDLIALGVSLGLLGLIGLALVWLALVADAPNRGPLMVVAVFAVLNGSLDYSAAIVVTLLFAAMPRQAEAVAVKLDET